MDNVKRSKAPWTTGEKALLGAVIAAVVLAAAGTAWHKQLDVNPTVTVPTPKMPSPNAYDYYVSAANAIMDGNKVAFAISTYHPKPPTPPPSLVRGPGGPGRPAVSDDRDYSPAEKQNLVAENAGVLKTLHQGFAYPYLNPPSRSFSTLFPQYAKERALARFLMLDSQVKAAQGDWAGAVSSNLDAIRMGEDIPRGGSLIAMLVGVACQAIGRKPLWNAVPHLDASQARAAAQRLEAIRSRHVPFAETLQEEEWSTQAGLMELFHNRNWRSGLSFSGQSDDSDNPQPRPQLFFVGKRTIMDNYTRYMDQMIQNARQPYAAHPAAPIIPNDPLNQILLPVFDKAGMKDADNETQNALLLTTLALRAYDSEHHTYPATLVSLVPGYLQSVPADPFAQSGPLRYRRAGADYVLYSVGPDGKDDGGKPIFDNTKTAPTVPGASDQRYYVQQDSKGDIVAGVNKG